MLALSSLPRVSFCDTQIEEIGHLLPVVISRAFFSISTKIIPLSSKGSQRPRHHFKGLKYPCNHQRWRQHPRLIIRGPNAPASIIWGCGVSAPQPGSQMLPPQNSEIPASQPKPLGIPVQHQQEVTLVAIHQALFVSHPIYHQSILRYQDPARC